MPLVRVKFRTGKKESGYVQADRLNKLIEQNRIACFYRESERKWINVKIDPVRGWGGINAGQERRSSTDEPETHFKWPY